MLLHIIHTFSLRKMKLKNVNRPVNISLLFFSLDQQVAECSICSSSMHKAIARSARAGALENTLITSTV